MQPNTISKINTAAEFLENEISQVKLLSTAHVLHSSVTTEPCCPYQFLQEHHFSSKYITALGLLFKKKQPTQNYLQAFLLDPPNLFCIARSTALEWLFLFKAIFVVELLQTPESCKQRQEPKNVSPDLKFTSALVTRTKKIKAGLSL